jgi:3-dehydroquinate dehydratase
VGFLLPEICQMSQRKDYLNEPSYRHCDKKEPIAFTFRTPKQGRHCERCQQLKPTNGLAHRKGWVCTDCMLEKKEEK